MRDHARILKERFPQAQVRDCSEIIWDLRRIKSPAEIEVLRQASRISAQADIEIMKAAHPDQYEYEISSLYEYLVKKEGARGLFDYGVIISSAENSTFLHYNGHNRHLTSGDFLVFDTGADFHDYDSDITISFPINGKFTPRQREIYEANLAVSKACLNYYKPGVTAYEVGAKVREELQKKGFDLTKDAFTRLQYFNMGGVTHHVGLATHDAGGTDVPKDQPLKAGMVFASDVFATYPAENLGVRVENVVLVTETGCENLSAGLPREVAEIEALMKSNAAGHWPNKRAVLQKTMPSRK